jgi:integrative and conjugative element protein (TIGR02256 family)
MNAQIVNHSMNIILSNKGILKLHAEPLAKMESYKQDSIEKLEAGGVLLGRFIKKSKNIILDRVTVPMVGDQRNRFSFIRSEKGHQRIISSAWGKSAGTCNYIGEWHTHPENKPNPSYKDIKNWEKILSRNFLSSQYLYFIIIGISEIGVWEGNRRSNKIIRIL